MTVPGPEGVFPLGWQQQDDREKRERAVGRLWQTPLVIFPPPPIDSVSSGSVLAGPPSSQGLDNMPSSALGGNLSQARFGDRSRRKWLSTLPCHFFHFQHSPFFRLCPSFLSILSIIFLFYWCRQILLNQPQFFKGLNLETPVVKQPCSPTFDIAFSQ